MEDCMQRLNREFGRIIGKVVAKTHCSEEEAKQSEVYKAYEDKINAIEIIADGLENCSDAISRIESIFRDDQKSGICLSTIHKSKGLESDRVFIIREDKMLLKHCMRVPWMAEQEYNLVYVAYTRAKHFLGFIPGNF
jgi:superfamily I DNA/RNA helicase